MGTTEAVVSIDDKLFQQFAPSTARWLMRTLIRKQHESDRWLRTWVAYVQDRAEHHYRRRRTDTMKRDGEWIRALGFVGKTRK
ncbi:hypothetical protein ASD68_03520 [Rhodanobacter sp. Root627]|uniref:hypothetical protein n=1 Tax=Rhodanobacter sp. Root627 TaxID=1736572 RepID=UPI0006FE6FD2|nr:hypothetical protein [Rhodanobacter sp. Root627]KRA35483.1 hypothetical protein ASD68_03520 [Rhodanobacter sp. Root627]